MVLFVNGEGILNDTESSASKCKYLVGDDTCGAVKEGSILVLRTEDCRNEVKDKCCYTCSRRNECEIGCDMLDIQDESQEHENTDSLETTPTYELDLGMMCGDCIYYLKPKCPRDYSRDEELWRRQDSCEFLP